MGKAEEHEAKELSLYQIQMEEQKKAELAAIELQEKRHKINNQWCDYMALIFEKYRDNLALTEITLTEITLQIFKNNGVDTMGKSVYECFDNIIDSDKHIEDYLSKQRGRHSIEMPEF